VNRTGVATSFRNWATIFRTCCAESALCLVSEMRGGETIVTTYKSVKKRIECAWSMRVSRYADTA